MKQFVLGFTVSTALWFALLSIIEIPEYTIVKEVTCV